MRGDQAGVLYAKGAFSEATELYAQVLKSKRDYLGEEHPSTLHTGHNLAGVLTPIRGTMRR